MLPIFTASIGERARLVHANAKWDPQGLEPDLIDTEVENRTYGDV